MTTSSKHISFETLLDFADRRLTPEGEAASHLSGCARCADEMDRLQGLVHLMREDRSVDTPRDVLAYAVNIFQQRRTGPRPSFVKRIVAALSFDSFDRAPAFGVRAGPGAARQLLYNAGGNDIDLRINEQENNRWMIAGQVLGGHCAGGEISLHGYQVSSSAYFNQQCEFSLPAVPAGVYELVLRLADVEVEVPRLEIGI